MAITELYANFDLATGLDDGTSEANAWKTWASAVAGWNGGGAGKRLNMKKTAARSALGAVRTFSLNATALAPNHIRGYGTVIGDGVRFEADAAGDRWVVSGCNTLISDIDVTGTSAWVVMYLSGKGSLIYDSIMTNTSAAAANGQYALQIIDASAYGCKATTAGTHATTQAVRSSRSAINHCYVASPRTCVTLGASGGDVNNCLLVGTGASALRGIWQEVAIANGQANFCGNTIYNFVDGILFTLMPNVNASAPIVMANNLIYDCTDGIDNAVSGATTASVNIVNNALGAITTNRYNFGDLPILGDIEVTADPFIAAGSDFRLNSAAGGGALCRAAAVGADLDLDDTIESALAVGALQPYNVGSLTRGLAG